ncbi:MAG: DUF4962 domain-containing protein [Chitinivibrionales bacterium]|nr:DUF4962 domain-containing protein [Chitinivibrionales bacterium]
MHRTSSLFLLCAAAICFADSSIVKQPSAGTFALRPELTGAHPRLHFTARDIPGIRQNGLNGRSWFLDKAKQAYGHYKNGSVTVPNSSDWKNYLYGLWGQFAMNMFYLVEQDSAAAHTAIDWAMHYAGNLSWLKDDLVPMDIASGMALTYDILYDLLTGDQRRTLRSALKQIIDFMYPEFFTGEYWTNDFQNNHLHNRMHGFAHACFAIYGDDASIDVQKEADLAVGVFEKVVAWLPEDGSNHEGPGYWDYGNHWVVRTEHLIGHVTGTDYFAQSDHFKNDYYFRLYLTAPGRQNTFNIGDGGGGAPGNITSWLHPITRMQDGIGQAVVQELMDKVPGGFYQHVAWGLLWYDSDLPAQDYSALPLSKYWPDLDMLSIRSSWDSSATAFVFKCGPPGGHKMQQMRGGDWVNVAHDHPDQNHFMLYAHGTMLAEDDGYPKQKKLARSHNTLEIDGKGQGREGSAWYQPFAYAETGYMEDVVMSRATAYAAGNASRLYEGAERFVRHIAFVEGEYVICIDDLVGADSTDHEFDWRLHKDGVWSKGQAGQFFVADGDARLDITFLEPAPQQVTDVFLPAELTAKPCLSIQTTAAKTRFSSVLVPQKNQSPSIVSEAMTTSANIAVKATHGDVEDLLCIAVDTSDMHFGTVAAQGSAALVRTTSNTADMALLVRGTSLALDTTQIITSNTPVDFVWRSTAHGVRIDAKPSHNETGTLTSFKAGSLQPGAAYSVAVNGGPVSSARADNDGMVTIELDLQEPASIDVTFGSSHTRLIPHRMHAGPAARVFRSSGTLLLEVRLPGYIPERIDLYTLNGRLLRTITPLPDAVRNGRVVLLDTPTHCLRGDGACVVMMRTEFGHVRQIVHLF